MKQIKDCPEQRDKRGAFITTYSGVKFFIDDCNIQDVPIEDIAHALSMNCRFNGHLKTFYSVAEHSIIMSHLVPEHHQLEALLHDISEAFVPDIPRPFKHLVQGFEEYEDRLYYRAAAYYDLAYPIPGGVRHIDKNIVRHEAEAFFESVPDWIEFYSKVAAPNWFVGLSAAEAKLRFLERFYYLHGKRQHAQD